MQEKLPEDVQDALRKGLLKRLPLTFLPFTNQHLREWEYQFPYERQTVQRLIVYVAGLSEVEFSSLFQDVVQLEEKMGVRHWKQFSTTEQTIENSSLLARSPYFQEWRRAVQAVFDVVDQRGPKTQAAAGKAERRLILLILPKPLPLDPETVWTKWQGIGRPLKLDLTSSGPNQSPAQTLLGGVPGGAGGRSGGLLDVALGRPDSSLADTWVCDAGSSLVDYLRTSGTAGATPPAAILLSYGRLASFRESFAHEMNTMGKDLSDADAVFDYLRKVEVTHVVSGGGGGRTRDPGVPALALSQRQRRLAVWKLVRRMGLLGSATSRTSFFPRGAVRNSQQAKTLYRRDFI